MIYVARLNLRQSAKSADKFFLRAFVSVVIPCLFNFITNEPILLNILWIFPANRKALIGQVREDGRRVVAYELFSRFPPRPLR